MVPNAVETLEVVSQMESADLLAWLRRISSKLEELERLIMQSATKARAVSVEESARLLSRTEAAVNALLGSGSLKAVEVDGAQLVPLDELIRLTRMVTPDPPAPNLPLPLVLTYKAAARQLSLKLSTIKTMVKKGELAAVPRGKQKGIPASELYRLSRAELPTKRRQAGRRKTKQRYSGQTEAADIRSELRKRKQT